ncbi:dopamine receptor 2-like [Acropora millepora]|uniref:dopamine receptor 2-like n=1 Tax=Acropora millepora TaxID=45264 RepID=UPI001CF16321|nr:dopamine receptor 2-like [Acropora millepora]
MDFNKWNPFWTSCFGVMAFLIIVGNTLTIATLLKKKFRKRPHFLVIGLAFADLLVGCATTLYVIVEYRLLSLSLVYNLVDMFASHSSVFHLAVISLERLHATLRPFRHKQLSLKVYWVAIATPWILSLSLWIFALVIHKISLRNFFQVSYIAITISLAISLLVTCFSYILIWVKRRRSQMRTFRQNQEARFSRTILIVTAASFLTWMPFQCVIVTLLLSQSFIPLSAILSIKLLRFSNSFVNFGIFFFRFPSYRKALFTLLTPLPRNKIGI